MAGEGKVRKGFYIEEDLLEQIDGLLEQADVKSRNEFLNQALKFYIGYLTSEKIENYMLSTISSVMHSTVKDSENRMVSEFTGSARSRAFRYFIGVYVESGCK